MFASDGIMLRRAQMAQTKTLKRASSENLKERAPSVKFPTTNGDTTHGVKLPEDKNTAYGGSLWGKATAGSNYWSKSGV